MEEVDKLIVGSLKFLGWTGGKEEPPSSLEEVPPSEIFVAVIMCVEKLYPDYQCPRPFPSQTAGRVSLAVQVCDIIKTKLGYRGSVAYQQLVYPAVDDNRKLLSWLVGQLPHEAEEEGQEIHTATRDLLSSIAVLVKESWVVPLALPPTPSPSPSCPTPFLKQKYREIRSISTVSLTPLMYTHLPRNSHPAIENYMRKNMRPITLEPSHRYA
jgi:hypothetical protein